MSLDADGVYFLPLVMAKPVPYNYTCGDGNRKYRPVFLLFKVCVLSTYNLPLINVR